MITTMVGINATKGSSGQQKKRTHNAWQGLKKQESCKLIFRLRHLKVETCKKDVTERKERKKDRIKKDAEHAKDIAEDTYIDRAPFI